MAIEKKELKSHYACIPNGTLEDPRLSLDTRGLLAFLLSKPEDWIIRASQIRRDFGIGQVVQQRIFRELERAGYLERKVLQGRDGRWTTGIIIHRESLNPL
jgi:hypothetical protein